MAKIPISAICPLSLWVRTEPEQGSAFSVQDNSHKAATGTNRRLVGRENSIANCKLQIANCKLNPSKAGHFSAQCETARGLFHHSEFRIHHSAFTLIEVLLTLCLLVIISAMAWPQLEKTFSGQRLRKAADIVRTQWTKARVEAMRTGSIRVFRYEISGNRYRIDMLSTDPVALLTGTTVDTASNDSAQTANPNNPASPQTSGSLNATAPFFQQILPKDITFVSSQTGLDPTAAAASNTTPATGDASSADSSVASSVPSVGTGWSEPIFFYPDGTTSDSRLQLQNKEGRTILVLLRGITGIVTIGNITAGGQL